MCADLMIHLMRDLLQQATTSSWVHPLIPITTTSTPTETSWQSKAKQGGRRTRQLWRHWQHRSQHFSISWQPSHGAYTRGYKAPAGRHGNSSHGGRSRSITRLCLLADRTTPEARPNPSASYRGGPASRRGCPTTWQCLYGSKISAWCEKSYLPYYKATTIHSYIS
jgi:hypothetical protein